MDKAGAASQQSQTQPRTVSPRDVTGSKRPEPSGGRSARAAVFKTPRKRKRLLKACDACHKSKRRCDGTAPCSNCYFASKECTYTDSTGNPVPAPNTLRPDIILSPPNTVAHSPTSINLSAPATASGSYPSPESHTPQLGTHHTKTLLSVNTGIPGPSTFASNRSSEISTRPSLDEAPRPRGSLRLDIPQDHLSPNRRLKKGPVPSNKPDELDARLIGQHTMGSSADTDLINAESAAYTRMDGTVTSDDFNKHVVHQLVNLFFAHCHPHRLIIHSASFQADLCRGRIPGYLLNAICAVSAPLSQDPLIRVTPVRQSGEKFADAALAALFDREGRLLANGVEAAQALALVQTYNVYRESSMESDLRLYDLALRILDSLRTLDSRPQAVDARALSSDEIYERTIKRESARRTFWLIHMVELLGAVFTKRPTTYYKDDLAGVRLPCDEESFDLALQVPSNRAEYLDSSALKTRNASEFGHVIRIATVLRDIERSNQDTLDPQAVLKCEQQLEQWVISLAEHLKYNPGNLQAHLSLWETGSNTSTWCYCFMHILHACAVLALSSVRRRLGQPACRDYESALHALPAIVKALGPRARNSILMGSVLWVQYCGPHAAAYSRSGTEPVDSSYGKLHVSPETCEESIPTRTSAHGLFPQLDLWIKEWEEFWGPATNHADGQAEEANFQGIRPTYQRMSSTAASALGFGPSDAEAHIPSSATATWNIPDVVIDPGLRAEDEPRTTPAQLASPALSSTSTLRVPPSQLLLPSLKSSGLLDIHTEGSIGSRSSGASTPVKQPSPWTLTSSPHSALLSPGLPASAGSGLSGSAPVSPHPHSPGFPASHMLQTRLQVPSFYQSNSPQPSPGIVGSPSPYEETETHASLTKFGSH